jgi:large subunit ribosomal protein L24
MAASSKATVKKDAVVVVISGKHKGSSGKILAVNRAKQQVTIEGINVRSCVVRKTRTNPQGGMVKKECPIHYSNVMLKDNYDARMAKRQASPTKTT